MAKCERFTHVGLNQRQEELVLVSSALVHLQDYVQHAIWVQVETSCRQKEQANRSRWTETDYYCVSSHKNRAALTPAAAGTFPLVLDLLPGSAWKPCVLPVLCLKDRFTYEGFDAFQNQVAGDVARQILAQLGDQFGVALVLLSQQVKLLLLVT